MDTSTTGTSATGAASTDPAADGSPQAASARRLPRRFASQRLRLPLLAIGGLAVSHGIAVALARVAEHVHPLQTPDRVLALGTLVALVVCAPLLWIYGALLSRRIARAVDVLERTRDGRHADAIATGAGDDVGMLCRSVNELMAGAELRERRIRESALVDALTGLPNRTLLNERIRQTLALSERSRAPFSVAVIDLDRFKSVNDTLGHATGDEVLREVARRLTETVRDSDTVARMGGDEFVLLLQGAESSAREVCARIVEAMRVPLRVREQPIDIGVSIGVAVHPQHGQTELVLLRNADAAMYQAKRRGGGVAFSDGTSPEVRSSYLSMAGELRNALDSGQLALEYQPRLDLGSGLIVGLEGLVRWHHPTRGCIAPKEFIAFAEQAGLLRDITRWVLEQGARFARELHDRDLRLQVSVNVSAQDVRDPSFADMVVDMLGRHGVEPGALCVELTESGIANAGDDALRNLRELAEHGVRLAVDDFGTGYATLSQLQQLPIAQLKIDRSFVSGMNDSRASTLIVRSTLDLGKQLGLPVIAEGVETLAELRALAKMGCDAVQGYYLAKPMPAADAIGWVEMRHALYRSSRKDYYQMLIDS